MSTLPVFVVWHSDAEDGEVKPINAEIDKDDADMYVLNGLVATLVGHLNVLADGGLLSIQVSRGRASSDEEPNPPGTHASLVINNPASEERGKDRHNWDFHVERRMAIPEPLSQPIGKRNE